MTFNAGSSIDFASNGAVVIKVDRDENGSIDSVETATSTYLLENSNLTFGTDDSMIYTIKILTKSNLTYQLEKGGDALTINAKR